jgi:hypothetical protein
MCQKIKKVTEIEPASRIDTDLWINEIVTKTNFLHSTLKDKLYNISMIDSTRVRYNTPVYKIFVRKVCEKISGFPVMKSEMVSKAFNVLSRHLYVKSYVEGYLMKQAEYHFSGLKTKDRAVILKSMARMGRLDLPYFILAAESAMAETDGANFPLLASAFSDARVNEEPEVAQAVTHLIQQPFDEERVEDLALGLWGSYLILGPDSEDVNRLADRVSSTKHNLFLHRFRRLQLAHIFDNLEAPEVIDEVYRIEQEHR